MNVRTLKTRYPVAAAIALAVCLSACSSNNNDGKKGALGNLFSGDFVDKEAFKNLAVQNLPPLNPADSAFTAMLLKDTTGLNLRYAYLLSDGAPIWFNDAGMKLGTAGLAEKLGELQEEGLHPEQYQVDYIRQALDQLKAGKSFPVDSIVRWDKAFTAAWIGAARDLLLGDQEIKKGDKQWFAGNDTLFNGAAFLVASMKKSEDFPSLDSFRPEIQEYGFMKKAIRHWKQLKNDSLYMASKAGLASGQTESNVQVVIQKELGNITLPENDSVKGASAWIAAYQYYHQLRISGKSDTSTLGSLRRSPDEYIKNLYVNMERLRALPRKTGDEHVWVNIPLMEVNYYRDHAVQFHGRVVVGKKARQTPTIWAPMANVVFNPPWGVPPTILKNDVGPGVGRSGSAYLSRKGLRAYDSKGRDVTASVNGSNYSRFAYRQPPGAHNSLGEVKFNLPNKWDIYLHDTPHRENFTSRVRALSSGCVRVQNPKLLAEAILEDRAYTPQRIDSIIQTRRTKVEQLKRYLPVYIVYLTVASDSTGNQLRYLDDVYGRDKEMMKVYN